MTQPSCQAAKLTDKKLLADIARQLEAACTEMYFSSSPFTRTPVSEQFPSVLRENMNALYWTWHGFGYLDLTSFQ